MKLKRKKNSWLKKLADMVKRIVLRDRRDDVQRMLDESW